MKAPLPPVLLKWERRIATSVAAGGDDAPGDAELGDRRLHVPLYLNGNRQDLLCTVDLTRRQDQSALAFYQRGIALVAWDQS